MRNGRSPLGEGEIDRDRVWLDHEPSDAAFG
jgi:hypothetical protein